MATMTSAPPGATKISGPSGLAGLTEEQIWRDPASKDIYRLPDGMSMLKGPSELSGLTEQQIWRDPNSVSIYRLAQTGAADITDQSQAKDFINSQQQSDMDKAPGDTGNPPIRTPADMAKDAGELISSLTGGVEKPQAPKFEEMFSNLRKEYDVSGLEDQLNQMKAAEENLFADFRQRKTAEEGKPVAMNVIEGRIGELSKAAQEDLDFIRRQKQTLTDQLNTKYNIISSLMKFREMDFTAARNDYDQQFNQSIQAYNIISGFEERQKTEEQRKRDDARANLTLIQNSIKDGNLQEVSPDLQLTITKLEAEAGMPIGFTETLRQDIKANIVSTSGRTAPDGTEYIDVLYREEDGTIKVKSYATGKAYRAPGAAVTSEADKLLKEFGADAAKLIEQLDTQQISWGAAFDKLKTQYPGASDGAINNALGGGVSYDSDTGAFGDSWGRASSSKAENAPKPSYDPLADPNSPLYIPDAQREAKRAQINKMISK